MVSSPIRPPKLAFFFLALLAVLSCLGSSAFAAPPAAPTNLTAVATSYRDNQTLIWRLNWMDNATTETHYRIYLFWSGEYQGEITQQIYNSTTNGTTAYTGPLSHFIFLSALSGNLQFAISAYNQTTGEESATAVVSFSSAPSWQTPVDMNAAGSIPSNVSAIPSPAGGDGAIRLTFTDNTNCEIYFQVQYKKHSEPESSYQTTYLNFNTTPSTVVADLAFYKARSYGADNTPDPVDDPTPDDELMFLPVFEPNTAYDIRVRALEYYEITGSPTFPYVPSGWSPVVTATTQPFQAPTNLTAVRDGENKFNLSFTSNSTAKSGHKFQYREQGTTTWYDLGMLDNPYSIGPVSTGALPPGVTYEFQVCAYIRGSHLASTAPTQFSGFSNTATGSTLFNAPTNLTASSPSEGRVNLAWTDNTAAETGYAVQARVKGSSQWMLYDYFNANTTSLTNQVIIPGELIEIRVAAFYGLQAEIASGFSNIVEVATTFNAPTNFTATASSTDPYRISFSWTDNSAVESHYELQYRKVGEANYATRKLVAANAGTAPNSMSVADLPEFDPGSVYDFRLRAVMVGSSGSVLSGTTYVTTTATTLDGFSSKPYAPITMGTPFTYTMTTIGQQSRVDWSVGTLPAGLSFDDTTGVISGTPTVDGLFMVPMTVNFAGGRTHVLNLALRILRPLSAPQIAQVIGPQTVTPGGMATVGLADKFSDLDTQAAVRMGTTKGDLDVVLYTALTPTTVANFRAYNYADTIFHRAPTGFVLQGGGYRIAASPDVFDSVTRQAPIANEPGISNLFGTVAMAKVGDDPDSATSEFFVSLGNNSLNLDNQNGGFTVFGRLSGPSTSALTALASVPTSSYGVKLRDEGGTTPTSNNFVFSDIPIDESPVPSAIKQDKLLKITAVTDLPVLTYQITNSPNSNVATATLNGTDLVINAVAPGTTSVTITATDVDANQTQQTVAITVSPEAGTVVLDNETLVQLYNGTPRAVTATTTPAGLTVAITYDGSSTPPTEIGTYAVAATIVDATYSGSTSGTLVIRGQNLAEWRELKFTPQQVIDGLSADEADPDGDGLKNLAEYALGTEPLAPTPALVPVKDGEGFSLTFTRPKGLPGVIYGAESSDSLASGSWTQLTPEVITDGPVQTVRVRDPLSSGNPSRRFIRLLFQLAP